MPLWYGNALSLQRYTYLSTDDIDAPAWQANGGGYNNYIYGDIRMEFVYNL